MKEVLLDTETTGLSSVKDKIIEIACIEIDDHIPTGEKFHVFLNPEMEISQGAYETHGITREFLDDKPKFKDIAKEFQEFINEKKLIIHNADFDLAFLNKRFKIDNSRRQKHSALLDCELLAKVYIELFEKKEPSLQFNMDNDESVVQNVKILKNREHLIQEITSEEKEIHKKFLKKDLPKSSMLN